jgi:hypothetical protein
MSNKTKITALLLTALTFMGMFATMGNFAVGATKFEKDFTKYGRVLLFTNFQPMERSKIAISLGLDDRIKLSIWGIANDTAGESVKNLDMSKYDVVICDCYLPPKVDQDWLKTQMLANNISLLFFGGNYTMGIADDFKKLIPVIFDMNKTILDETMTSVESGILNGSNTLSNEYLDIIYSNTQDVNMKILDADITIAVADEESARNETDRTIFSTNIAWTSCPVLSLRTFTFSKMEKAHTIVEIPDTSEPLVVLANCSDLTPTTSLSEVMYISMGLGNITFDNGKSAEMNVPFALWPYFNYLLFLCVFYMDADFAKANLESYSDWPYSPIPHEKEAGMWMTFVAALWIFNFTLFFTLGKKKKSKDAKATTDASNAAPAGITPEQPLPKDSEAKSDAEPKL